jgi:hypothetical protein
MSTQYFHHIHLPHPFLTSSPSHWCQPPDRTCFAFLFSIVKKRHFCLFKISLQGFSLWQFHVYMYYNLNWFMPFIFLFSALVPFLWWFQQVKNSVFILVSWSFVYRNF